jgi:hypothetical protein
MHVTFKRQLGNAIVREYIFLHLTSQELYSEDHKNERGVCVCVCVCV